DPRRERGRPLQEVGLLSPRVGDADPEVEHHHAAHGVGGEGAEHVGAGADAASHGLVSAGEAEEEPEHQGEGQRGDAEGRDAEIAEQLRPGLHEEHPGSGGDVHADAGQAHDTASFLVCWSCDVRLMKASSRSAPTTSRFWIWTPRSKRSRSTDSGSLLSSRTLASCRSSVVYGRSWRSASVRGCSLWKLTRFPATRDLISAGLA